MKNKAVGKDDIDEFEKALANMSEGRYVLRLYLTGTTPRSVRALKDTKAFCERSLKGRYELEVIDLYLHPHRAKEAQILAAPTLVKELPLPLRRLIGDFSDNDRIMIAMDLKSKKG